MDKFMNRMLIAVALLVALAAVPAMACYNDGGYGGGGYGGWGNGGYGSQCNNVTIQVGVFSDTGYANPIPDSSVFNYQVTLLQNTSHVTCNGGMWGWCWGGYTTTYTVTQVDQVNIPAAVLIPGTTNLYLTQDGNWHFGWYDRNMIWQHRDWDFDWWNTYGQWGGYGWNQDGSSTYQITIKDVPSMDNGQGGNANLAAYVPQTPQGFTLDWQYDNSDNDGWGGQGFFWHVHCNYGDGSYHDWDFYGTQQSCTKQTVTFNYAKINACTGVVCPNPSAQTCVQGACIPNTCGTQNVGVNCDQTVGGTSTCPGGYTSTCTQPGVTCTGDTGSYCTQSCGHTNCDSNGNSCSPTTCPYSSGQCMGNTCTHQYCKSDGSSGTQYYHQYVYGQCMGSTCNHQYCNSNGNSCSPTTCPYSNGQCIQTASCPLGYTKTQTQTCSQTCNYQGGCYYNHQWYNRGDCEQQTTSYNCVASGASCPKPAPNNLQTAPTCAAWTCHGTVMLPNPQVCPTDSNPYTLTEIQQNFGNCPTGYTCVGNPTTGSCILTVPPAQCTSDANCLGGYFCDLSSGSPGVCAPINSPPGGIGGGEFGNGPAGDNGYDASGNVIWVRNPAPGIDQGLPIYPTGSSVGYTWHATNTEDLGNFIEVFDANGQLRYGPTMVVGTNISNYHDGSGTPTYVHPTSAVIDVATNPPNNINSRWTVILLGIDPVDGPIAHVLAQDKMYVYTGAPPKLPTETPTPDNEAAINVGNQGSS